MSSVSGEGMEGWGEYRKLILAELERLNRVISALDSKLEAFRNDDISSLKVEVAMLKVKAGLWGALAGLVPAIGAILYMLAARR